MPSRIASVSERLLRRLLGKASTNAGLLRWRCAKEVCAAGDLLYEGRPGLRFFLLIFIPFGFGPSFPSRSPEKAFWAKRASIEPPCWLRMQASLRLRSSRGSQRWTRAHGAEFASINVEPHGAANRTRGPRIVKVVETSDLQLLSSVGDGTNRDRNSSREKR